MTLERSGGTVKPIDEALQLCGWEFCGEAFARSWLVSGSISKRGSNSRSRREATRMRCSASARPCSTPASSCAKASSRLRNGMERGDWLMTNCAFSRRTVHCNNLVNERKLTANLAARNDVGDLALIALPHKLWKRLSCR
jgi:hypothetical protein